MRKIIGIIVGVLALGGLCIPVFGDEWDLSEDGQYWQYYGYTDEPLKDEWIEDGGKTYYVDSNGYMKTGWVSNADDGNQYYMGEDGAMVKNAFTPDDRYVGPDGVIIEKYDTYRKAVKAEINKAAGQSRTDLIPYFLLVDLNKDEYRDLVVMYAYAPEDDGTAAGQNQTADQTANQTEQGLAAGQTDQGLAAGQTDQGLAAGQTDQGQATGQMAGQAAVLGMDEQTSGPTGGNLVEIAVWDTEEEAFQLAAEFDETGEGEYSTLYADPNGGGVWLEIMENEESLRLFQMETDTSRFRGGQSFSMDLDEWGGAEYYINGNVEEKTEWDEEILRAKQERGNLPLRGYLPVNDENIKKEVDRELEEKELYLWE